MASATHMILSRPVMNVGFQHKEGDRFQVIPFVQVKVIAPDGSFKILDVKGGQYSLSAQLRKQGQRGQPDYGHGEKKGCQNKSADGSPEQTGM